MVTILPLEDMRVLNMSCTCEDLSFTALVILSGYPVPKVYSNLLWPNKQVCFGGKYRSSVIRLFIVV